MLPQIIQVVGSLLILAAFILLQTKRVSAESPGYLISNIIGAGTLTVLAFVEHQWGFLLLESVWTIVSLFSLMSLRHKKTPAR